MNHDSPLIVSVSGIRGVVGAGLTPDRATAFAAALGTATAGGRIVLSRDGRPSGEMLRSAILAGLLATGCEAIDLGIAPTPTCGLAVRRLGADGAIQITASHNSAEWNGLKLFGPDGAVLSPARGQEIKALYEASRFAWSPWDRLGRLRECHDAAAWHRDRVLELVDVARIRARAPRVLLDGNGGAGGPLGRQLLDALGCATTPLACDADGHFAHEPEPIEANLGEVGPQVAQSRSEIGFVLDPDSDRLALIDETGRPIGEERTLALAVLFRLSRATPAESGPVVINMSTSRLVEDIAARFGVPCYRAPVGEANVVAKMRAVGALIGGEGNGGVIDPRVGEVRDPFIGMGLVLNLLTETHRPLSALVAELPTYTIIKEKYTIDPRRLGSLFAALEARWPEAEVNREDGLRLAWADRWAHVRASNTEPIVRVIAEAPRADQAQALCHQVGELLVRS